MPSRNAPAGARAILIVAALAVCGTVHAATWHGIPGTEELQVDLSSIQQQRLVARAWLRQLGHSSFAGAPVRVPRLYRTVLLTEFDCQRRTARVIAANAYDSGGVALAMSSVPGPVQPVPALGDLAWAYDAVCELARSGA